MEDNSYDMSNLLKTVSEWVSENGGAKLLADIIISENHEIYKKEAVQADIRLHNKGIFTYDDIKPLPKIKCSDYTYNAIATMYSHYSYAEMARILNRPLRYVSNVVFILIKQGRITRNRFPYSKWSYEEDCIIKKYGRTMSTENLSKLLNRTIYAIGTRKSDLGITMDETHKKPSGRIGFLKNKYEKERNDTISMVQHL